MSISILILTLNEETNIGACLDSLAGFDDIVVFDSVSKDKTVEIAVAKGARIVERPFDNWAAHQNWAMDNIDFKHGWVFYLDADERMTPELRDEILAIARDSARPEVAYYCGRKNFFLGKWIRHAMPPGMIMRFFKPKKIRFERLVNPVPVIDGPHGYLRHFFEHYNFSKGLTEWFDKHNKYSLFEAMEGMKLREKPVGLGALFSGDRFERRRALKELSFRMPLRPLVKFLYMYVLKLGFLDGRAGYTYCKLQSMYEYMIVVKMRELARKERGLPV
ncbi:MAG: glycosyltransferase family 2 protein [bacterium]|jgi:glycosyltransferase involved in cell wall biosynthesis